MWDGVGFTLSLSTDEDIPEVVHLDWVEKDRVKGVETLSLDLKGLASDVREPFC
jgi:hypothetical protein